MALCDLCPVSIFSVGGLGLSLRNPSIQVCAEFGQGALVLDDCASRWRNDLEALLGRFQEEHGLDRINVTVRMPIPPHSGFGSHTALSLALIEAVSTLAELRFTERQILDFSRRGGTSGIGIQTYFRGGVALDYGRRSKSSSFMPSSAVLPKEPPVFGQPLPFPKDWRIEVLLPVGRNIFGSEEVSFFERNTPISEIDALRVISCIHHGVVPAILSADLSALFEALRQLHLVGFKCLELQAQTESVRHLYGFLVSNSIACGLSSFGPALYAIVNAADHLALEVISDISTKLDIPRYSSLGVSLGREIQIDG